MATVDRLSLRIVALDYWRSLRDVRTGRADVLARVVLLVLPVAVGVAVVATNFKIKQPTSLLPALSLLSGVLLASAGQIITLRSRIADSVLVSGDKRVRAQIRETISGIVLAAVAALADALALGSLTLFDGLRHKTSTVLVSGVAATLTTYVALMFVVTARRLYATFLEAFEGGRPLPRGRIGAGSDLAPTGAVESTQTQVPVRGGASRVRSK